MYQRNGFRHFTAIFALGFCIVLPPVTGAAEEIPNTKKPWQCTLRLLDPDGKPVAGGKVTAYQETKKRTPGMQVWEILTPVDPSEAVSDENGRVTIRYPEEPAKTLYIEVNAEGFVPLRYVFGENELFVDLSDNNEIPSEFDVHLSPGVPAGGVVRGSDGEPLEGAVVVVQGWEAVCETENTPEPVEICFLILKTDAAGKWACRVPRPDQEKLALPERELTKREAAELLEELKSGAVVDNLPVTVTVNHSDYAPKEIYWVPEQVFQSLEPHQKLLHALKEAGYVAGTTFNVVLEKGVDLPGRVVDESGKPLPNVRVLLKADTDGMPRLATAETGKDGRFVARHLLEEPSILFATRAGFSPCIRSLEVAADTGPLRLVMKKAGRIQLTVRDSSGQAVRAEVVVHGAGQEFLNCPLDLLDRTDDKGNWTWDSAPVAPCSYEISAEGFETIYRTLPPGEHTITLTRPGFVIGRVIDAATKAPIGRFFVSRKKVVKNDSSLILGDGNRALRDGDWRNLFASEAPDGIFRCICREEQGLGTMRPVSDDPGDDPAPEIPEPEYLGVILRVEAEGYLPATSKTLPWQEDDVEVTFEMKKAASLAGRIVDAKGRPVGGAEVALIAEDRPAIILDRCNRSGFQETIWVSPQEFHKGETDPCYFSDSFDFYNPDEPLSKQPSHARSDKAGRFTLFPQKAPYELVVAHKDGFAQVTNDTWKPGSDIVLGPWASLEGIVERNGKPLPEAEVQIDSAVSPDAAGTPSVLGSIHVEMDANGRFQLDRLPPGKVRILGWTEDGDFPSNLEVKTVTLSPGETKKVRLDGDEKEEKN